MSHPTTAARSTARRGAVALAVAVLAVACGRDRRSDVLLIVLDTVRADHLSLYGYPRLTSPALDALAADATVYRNAFAPGTWTAPSHASLFTGLLPTSHGVRLASDRTGGGVRALDASAETLAERLHSVGYRTAAFVGNEACLDPVFGLACSASMAAGGTAAIPCTRSCTCR